MTLPAFEVDKAGLAMLLERRGKAFAVLELIQNALDERVTRVDVTLEPVRGSRGYHTLIVKDDCPSGFADLRHAFTLFAESKKKASPTQRGRFNLGEKLVLAICRQARILTTTGGVEFEGNTRRMLRRKTEVGSTFMGEIKMTQDEAKVTLDVARSVIVPDDITLTINGEEVPRRAPFKLVEECNLLTEYAGADGVLRRCKRKTTIAVHNPHGGCDAHLYEMGIPVVPIDCAFDVDVHQKVPLNMDRDNVLPGFLSEVLTRVLNLTYQELDEEEATDAWVSEALESRHVSSDAVEGVLARRFGENRVAYDPSDPEGSKIAVSRGYTVVHGGNFSSSAWENIRRAGALKPAGQVTPSPKPFHPDGRPLKVLPREEWTDSMLWFESYAQWVARECLYLDGLKVVIANDRGWKFRGAYGDATLTVNMAAMTTKRQWFERCHADMDRLLIHELAHHRAPDHLSHKFHEECCRIGARLVELEREVARKAQEELAILKE